MNIKGFRCQVISPCKTPGRACSRAPPKSVAACLHHTPHGQKDLNRGDTTDKPTPKGPSRVATEKHPLIWQTG